MTVYNVIIGSGVAAAALVCYGHGRYLAWIAAILASYALSVIYWDLSLPYPEFFAGCCDLLVVMLLAWKARYIWELWLGLLFLTMSFVNLVYFANNLLGASLVSHQFYSGILEVANIAAILLIGGTCSFEKSGFVDAFALRPWMFFFGRLRPAYSRSRTRS